MATAYEAPIQESTTNTASGYGNLASVNPELQALLNSRVSEVVSIDREISEIVRKTEREVGYFSNPSVDLKTKKQEFLYKDGSLVKSNVNYHIHYTTDTEEYFMTGLSHNKMSRLIYPINNLKTNFGHYNNLNKQSRLYISSQATVPTEDDYANGSFTRYFAQKANEKQSPVFEVSVDDFGSSSLYEFVTLTWYIIGTRNQVYSSNSLEVITAQKTLPTINNVLTPFQYYRFEENLSNLDKIRNALANMGSLLSGSPPPGYNTNTLNDGSGVGGAGGTCSLGPQYTTKEACIAAGGIWSDGSGGGSSGLLDSDGNYLNPGGPGSGNGLQEYDANGNELENLDDKCK